MNSTNRTSPDRPRQSKFLRSLTARGTAIGAALLVVGAQFPAAAQSDNFDSYSTQADLQAAGWILASLNPALVTTTFPATGMGKGLRIQAIPFPPQAPAVAEWYRTNEYTDFYMSVDIASWPGTDKNQAAVMFARVTDATTWTVPLNLNPANAQGIICNYDASQYGENPGDRRQGQFQINTVSAGFNTLTLAVAEITFVPGRAYRLVFKGSGTNYTAQAYDFNDLTTPLVTIHASDTVGAFTNGACGVLVFSRQGTSGTADITFDNYYAGTTDPNPAPAPAMAHPVPGTPAVVTRVPSARWRNFLSPTTAISFTANTYTTNIINAAATKARLNGVDVSSQLTLSANGTSITGSLPATLLDTNKLYSGEIVVTDIAGTKSSTNTFWFDTFSDSYLLSSSVKIIEAEEYNYTNGGYQLDPIPVSGLDTNGTQVNGFGVGYFDPSGLYVPGTAGIDFSNRNAAADANFSAFRADPVRNLNGGLLGIEDADHANAYEPGTDTIRSPHAAVGLLEYVICRTEPNEWLDYTRSFAPAFYTAYLRYSSFGATSNELHRVTSDPTQPGQTTVKLGNFKLANNIRYLNYLYAPLVDDAGAPVMTGLTGTNTLRLQITGTPGEDVRKAMQNYIMMVQVPVKLYSSATVDGAYALEAGATVDVSARTISVATSGGTRFYRVGSTMPVTIKSISVSGGNVTISL